MNVDLSTERGYIIATALRGPDLDYPTLKYIITGWIRAQCGVTHTDCVIRDRALTEQDVEKAREEVKTLYHDETNNSPTLHWLSHTSQAIELLPTTKHRDWLLIFNTRLIRLVFNPTEKNKEAVYDKLKEVE